MSKIKVKNELRKIKSIAVFCGSYKGSEKIFELQELRMRNKQVRLMINPGFNNSINTSSPTTPVTSIPSTTATTTPTKPTASQK